jgi:hypothetical protein
VASSALRFADARSLGRLGNPRLDAKGACMHDRMGYPAPASTESCLEAMEGILF